MKFQTPAGQAAYEEHLRVAGEQIDDLRRRIRELVGKYPTDAVPIHVTEDPNCTELLIEAHADAIRLGTHVDIQWAELKARLMMCASDRE